MVVASKEGLQWKLAGHLARHLASEVCGGLGPDATKVCHNVTSVF